MILPYDYGLGLIRSFTASFRLEIVRRCHGRALSDVVREYDIPYTTLETCIEKIRYCYQNLFKIRCCV